jgi:hypothetical protein
MSPCCTAPLPRCLVALQPHVPLLHGPTAPCSTASLPQCPFPRLFHGPAILLANCFPALLSHAQAVTLPSCHTATCPTALLSHSSVVPQPCVALISSCPTALMSHYRAVLLSRCHTASSPTSLLSLFLAILQYWPEKSDCTKKVFGVLPIFSGVLKCCLCSWRCCISFTREAR